MLMIAYSLKDGIWHVFNGGPETQRFLNGKAFAPRAER